MQRNIHNLQMGTPQLWALGHRDTVLCSHSSGDTNFMRTTSWHCSRSRQWMPRAVTGLKCPTCAPPYFKGDFV